MSRGLPPQVGRSGDAPASGVVPVLVLGGWLAATMLFGVGIVLVAGTVLTALGPAQGLPTVLLALLGGVGAYALAPTLATVVVVAVVEGIASVSGRALDAEPGGRRGRTGRSDETVRYRTLCCG